MQRADQLRELGQRDLFNSMQIADFTFHKDPLFAELTLAADELNLYRQLHEHVMVNVPIPDLVIYLQAPVDILLHRISKRGIRYEEPITAEYLRRLTELYLRFFQGYDAGPLLIVDTSRIDLVDDVHGYQELLEAVSRIKSGRHTLWYDTFL